MSTSGRDFLLTIVAALASILVAVSCAHAGAYTMRSCNVPGNRSSSVGPWLWDYSYHSQGFNYCSAGAGFGFVFQNQLIMDRLAVASLVLQRQTIGPKSSIAIRRVKLWLTGRLSGTGSFLYVVTRAYTPGSATQTDVFGPPGGSLLDEPLVSPILPVDTREFRVVLACSGSSGDNCYPANRRPLEVQGAEVTLEEYVAPSASITGGTAVGYGPQSGVRSVTYVAGDSESGVARIEVMLGDDVVGVRDLAAACSYADFAACPATDSDDVIVDTRAVPDGSYLLRLRVTDAAGNRTIIQSAAPVRVANRSATRLTARFVATSRRTLTTSFGRHVTVWGRVTDSDNRPITNAQVDLQERPVAGGAQALVRRRVSTDFDGRWRYTLGNNISSRNLRFQYGASSRTLSLKVRASAVLHVNLRGTLVRFDGRVLSRPVPPKGLRVFVQGRARGAGWQTFASPRSDRAGRFSGRYRLRVHRPGIVLQFRARVRATRGYPFAPGLSGTSSRVVR